MSAELDELRAEITVDVLPRDLSSAKEPSMAHATVAMADAPRGAEC